MEHDNITSYLDDDPINDRGDLQHFSGFDTDEIMQQYHEAERHNIEHDDFLGIGNKKKKAEKKLAKAEKALASGNTGKAQRKIDKALKKLGKDTKHDDTGVIARAAQDQANLTAKNQAKQDAISDIEASKGTTTSTPVGQMGATADSVTPQGSPSAIGMPSSGGGGGGGGDMDMGYVPDPSQQGLVAGATEPTPEGDPNNPMTLPGVTVTNDTKKNNLVVIVAVVVVIAMVVYFMRKKK